MGKKINFLMINMGIFIQNLLHMFTYWSYFGVIWVWCSSVWFSSVWRWIAGSLPRTSHHSMDHTFTHKLSMEDGKSKYSFGVPITKQLLNATKLIHFPPHHFIFDLFHATFLVKLLSGTNGSLNSLVWPPTINCNSRQFKKAFFCNS